VIRGSLFTRFYLDDGIRETDAYRSLDDAAVSQAGTELKRLWSTLAAVPRPSEDDTEAVMILPAIVSLGWPYLTRPPADRGRRDIADAALFPDEAARRAALGERHVVDRLRHGTVITEWEALHRPLDRASAGRETPSN